MTQAGKTMCKILKILIQLMDQLPALIKKQFKLFEVQPTIDIGAASTTACTMSRQRQASPRSIIQPDLREITVNQEF